MRIAMVGTGYVGLVSGVCFSDFGHTVICVDKDASKIEALNRGEVPIYEPGLDTLIATNTAAGRLTFTTDLGEAMDGADAVFIAVGTPTKAGGGSADLTYVFAAADEIATLIRDYTVVVTKSTVPVGTNRRIETRLADALDRDMFDVASNPEFLREGAAIEDFMRPDRVVVGVASERADAVMQEIYHPMHLRETPIVSTDFESAEMIKYAANAFLATKITFINQVADLCEAVGADVQMVAKGIGLDDRIGNKFLNAGPGFGGSCFPKDTRALVTTADEYKVPLSIVSSVVSANDARQHQMATKIMDAAGGDVSGKRIAILGVTFKPNTDDMREAPSLVIIPALRDAGADLVACDPQGQREAAHLLGALEWADDPYTAASGADILVLLTEWNEFRALNLSRIAGAMRGDVFVDLRNVYTPADARQAGFAYTSVGRP